MRISRFLVCVFLLLSAGWLQAVDVTVFETFDTNPTTGWTKVETTNGCKFIWMQDALSKGHMYAYYTRYTGPVDRFVKALPSTIAIGGGSKTVPVDPNAKVYLEMDGLVVGGINNAGTGNAGVGRADSNNSTQVLFHRFYWGSPENISCTSGFASRLSAGAKSYWHSRTAAGIVEPRAVRYKAEYSYRKADPGEAMPVIDCNTYAYEINNDGSTGALIGAGRTRQDPNDTADVNTITVDVMGIFNQYTSTNSAAFIEAYVDNLYVSTTGFNGSPVKPSWFNPNTTGTVIPAGQTNTKNYVAVTENFNSDPAGTWTAVYGRSSTPPYTGYTGKSLFTWKSYLNGGYLDAKLVREGGETYTSGSYWTGAPYSSARYYRSLGQEISVLMSAPTPLKSPMTWFMQYDAYTLDIEPGSEAIIGGGEINTTYGSYTRDLIGSYFYGSQDQGEGIKAYVGGYDVYSNNAAYATGKIDFDPNNNEQIAGGLLAGHSYRFKFYTGAFRSKPRIIGLIYEINEDGSDGNLIGYKTSTVGYGYPSPITPIGFRTDSIGLYTSVRYAGNPVDRINHLLVDNIYFSTLGFQRVNVKPSWMETPECDGTTQYLDTDLGNADGVGAGYYDCQVDLSDLDVIGTNWLYQGN